VKYRAGSEPCAMARTTVAPVQPSSRRVSRIASCRGRPEWGLPWHLSNSPRKMPRNER
jgi:hypothetical protein